MCRSIVWMLRAELIALAKCSWNRHPVPGWNPGNVFTPIRNRCSDFFTGSNEIEPDFFQPGDDVLLFPVEPVHRVGEQDRKHSRLEIVEIFFGQFDGHDAAVAVGDDGDVFGAGLKQKIQTSLINRTARLKKCKQLFEYRHLLLLSDTWWLKLPDGT